MIPQEHIIRTEMAHTGFGRLECIYRLRTREALLRRVRAHHRSIRNSR